MNESLIETCAMIFDRVDFTTPNVVQKKKDYVVCEKFFHEKKKEEEEGSITSNFLFLVCRKYQWSVTIYENKKQAYCNEVICGNIAKRK